MPGDLSSVMYMSVLSGWHLDTCLVGHPEHRPTLCREALGRTGTSLLAQGSDGIKLQSEVRLLDEQEGQYMIGSVQFTKPQKTAQQGFTASHSDRDMPSASRPSLDSVMGSVRGQALLDSQVCSWKLQPAAALDCVVLDNLNTHSSQCGS